MSKYKIDYTYKDPLIINELNEPLNKEEIILLLNNPYSDMVKIAISHYLHYPECWDTSKYPTLEDALIESEYYSFDVNDIYKHGCMNCHYERIGEEYTKEILNG